jgi:hypothetical protein
MDETRIARPAGADGLTVLPALLAAGIGQRHGMRVSSDGFASAYGPARLRPATGEWSGMAVTLARVPVAVGVRTRPDGNVVPGAPPRGAPV